jgi:hypothetical protein
MQAGILVLAALLASCSPCRAQAPERGASAGETEMDLQSYQQELSRIEGAGRDVGEVRQSLPESWAVKAGGTTYHVSTREISDALVEIDRDPKKAATAEQLKTRLQAMRRQAADLAAGRPSTKDGDAEAKLDKILKRGEFQEAAGPSAWDLVRARINRWILEHLIGLLSLLHISEKTGNAIAWGVIIAAVVLLFYVVYGWLSKADRSARFRAEVKPAASDARQWVQEAVAAADRGDFREAVHCAYWASVTHLEDIRVLPRDRSRTPRESLRLLEQHPREQGLLQSITHSFELIWYGYRPASAVDWAGAKEQLEKMGCLQVSIAPTAPS